MQEPLWRPFIDHDSRPQSCRDFFVKSLTMCTTSGQGLLNKVSAFRWLDLGRCSTVSYSCNCSIHLAPYNPPGFLNLSSNLRAAWPVLSPSFRKDTFRSVSLIWIVLDVRQYVSQSHVAGVGVQDKLTFWHRVAGDRCADLLGLFLAATSEMSQVTTVPSAKLLHFFKQLHRRALPLENHSLLLIESTCIPSMFL